MSNTYGLLFLLGLAFAQIASAQSLEDKVSQSRRLQAQSLMGLDEDTIDSLVREKKIRQGARLPTQAPRGSEEALLDSLIAGPEGVSADSLLDDSLRLPDSLGRGRMARKPIPARYEQRIFHAVNRSLFASSRGAVGRSYVLGPGDELTVSLWGDKEQEYNLVLNQDGKIFMEGLGLIPLAGLNLDEAQLRLKERLARIYSGINRGTSHVEVSVGRAGPARVFVLGEVKVPGGYVLTGNSSIMSALYFAQGPTDIGTVRNLQLTRDGKKLVLDLYEYLIHGRVISPGVLRDGDILFASRADALAEIQGDVGRPAVYELRKGEGVKVIEFAGRLNPTAASHRMVLQRVFPGGGADYVNLAPPEDYVSGKAVLELQDGDKLLVEKSTESTRNFITVTGPVKYPGTYSAEGIRSVSQLISKAGGPREDAFPGRVHVVRYRPDGSSNLFAYSLSESPADSIQLEPRDNVLLYSLKDMYLPDSVEVVGAVFNPGRYEFREGMTAKDLVMQSGGFLPQHESGRLLVFRGGARERNVEPIVLNVKEALGKSTENNFALKPRDMVHVPIHPRWYVKEVVTLDGLFLRPGKYALLHPNEKLADVIKRVGGFKDDAYVEGGRFFRTRDSVGRVGVDIAKALASPGSKTNIALVGGDSIYIPARLGTVKVMGEVGFETSVLYKNGASVQYYIEKAGGFTRRSEKDRIVVQYANGETSRDGYFNRKPDAGSAIYVPQGPEPKPVDWFMGINAILGTVSVALAVILSIQAVSN